MSLHGSLSRGIENLPRLSLEAAGVDEPLASVTTVFGRLRKERDLEGRHETEFYVP